MFKCTKYALFVFYMQKLQRFKILLVDDPKPTGEPNVKLANILKTKYVPKVEAFIVSQVHLTVH